MLSPQGKAAALALEGLEGAVLTARRYGPGHRNAQKALDGAAQALEAYTAAHQALTVSIRRHGVVVADEVVLGREDSPCELMRLLLPDGIAKLTFDPGCPRDELEALAGMLSEHWRGDDKLQAGDGRLLSSLWGLGLVHVTYRVYDPLAPNATRVFQRRAALGTHADDAPQLAPVASRAGELVERQVLLEEGAPPSQRFFRRLLRSSPPSADPRDWSTLPERARAYLEDPEGRARRKLLQRLPETEQVERERALDLLEWSVRQPQAPGPTECGRFLAGVAAACLAEGDLAGAASTLSRSSDLDDPAEVRRALTALLGTRGGLEQAARALRAHAEQLEPDELIRLGMRYLRYLDAQALAPACQLYPLLPHSDVRRVFRRLLTSHVETHADLIEPLTRAQEETIVTEAVGILALGEPGSRGRELLEAAAQGTLEPRRTLALEALDVVTGERARRELSRVVADSEDRTARLSALKRLKADGSPRAYEELAELVSKPEFAQRDEQEQHLAFDALTELGGLRSVRVLTEIAQRRTGLFKRKQVEQLKQNAHVWLQRLKRKR